ncbi:MAG: CDP-diacylglycerol--glycerol-3-phosphate 3-phosphatidyltransferase [Clostridia bacterium]|nr:CDP-diacylglycerol--glycerol-3-phosphate 3-phosphatidyltransferase [Clostridia bacterium]
MITPNVITVIRILMIPVFVLFFYLDFEASKIVAAVIFAVAAFTDFLDGYIARKYKLVTNMGKFLDPIADKVLVSTAFIVLLSDLNFMRTYDWVPVVFGIFVAVILARELIISGFREIAAERNIVLAAGMLGKIKTTVQDISIFVLLISISLLYYMAPQAGTVLFIIGFVLFCVAVLLTLASGIEYIVSNREVLRTKKSYRR